jgi:hypothetical protein
MEEHIKKIKDKIFDEFVDGVIVARTVEKYSDEEGFVDFSKIDFSKLSEQEENILTLAVRRISKILDKKLPILFIKYPIEIGEIEKIKDFMADAKGKYKNDFVYYKVGDEYRIAYGKLKSINDYYRLDVLSLMKAGKRIRIIKGFDGRHFIVKKDDVIL